MEQEHLKLVAELYIKHNEKMVADAYSMVGNNQLAHDIVAKTFYVALIKADILYEHPKKLSWLYKVMYNKVKEVYHTGYITDEFTGNKIKIVEQLYANINQFLENTSIESPYDEVNAKIDNEEPLGSYKGYLRSKEYEFIRQRFENDKTLLETAEELGISYDSSRHLWVRIKNKILKHMKKL